VNLELNLNNLNISCSTECRREAVSVNHTSKKVKLPIHSNDKPKVTKKNLEPFEGHGLNFEQRLTPRIHQNPLTSTVQRCPELSMLSVEQGKIDHDIDWKAQSPQNLIESACALRTVCTIVVTAREYAQYASYSFV